MAKVEFYAAGLKENDFITIVYDHSGVIVSTFSGDDHVDCCLSWIEWRTFMRMLRGHGLAEDVLKVDVGGNLDDDCDD